MVHAEEPEKRTPYAFRPTNEKPLTAFLVARNHCLFSDHDVQKSPSVRKHAALQSQLQQLLNQYIDFKFSSPYDSLDAKFGLRKFKFIQETNCWLIFQVPTTGKL